MATVINNPGSSNDSGGSGALILGIVVILGILAALYFGAPYLRGNPAPASVQNNVQQPADTNDDTDTTMQASPTTPTESTGTQINVPEQIDVNVNGTMNTSQPSSQPASSPAQ